MCYGLYVDLPGLPRQQKSTLPGTNYAYIFSAYKTHIKDPFFFFIKKYWISLGHIFSLKSSLLTMGYTDCK